MNDSFSEDEIKALLMELPPPTIGVGMIVEAMGNANAGFVVWDATPPRDVPYHQHRMSFLEAIHTGLAFCGTDTRDEWCVLGATGLILMRSMPEFIQCKPVVCGPLVYVGRHRTTFVYTDARERRPPRGGNEFVVGVAEKAARGLIQNSPTSFA